MLGTFVDEAMSFADSHAIPLDAVSVSGGPGSYTGLRIGVSMAKGICYALNIPLLSVSTLELMCVPVLLHHEEIEDDALLCPMIDARRMEVYAAIYDRSLKALRPIQADVVDGDTYRQWLDERPVYFFGNGAAKCIDTIAHPNARLIEGIELRWEGEGINEKGIDVKTGKVVVAVSEDFFRPTDVVNLWGDPTKAKKELGWNPQTTSFEELVRIMVNHDMQKVAADHVASVMRTNLAEYLEKGIVK